MKKVEFIEWFKNRTKIFSVEVIMLYDKMKKTDASRIVGKQLIRSSTSVGANYRAACISRSNREFFAKMSIVVEEADETIYWLEILKDTKMIPEHLIDKFIAEAIEISKIVSKARKNARL